MRIYLFAIAVLSAGCSIESRNAAGNAGEPVEMRFAVARVGETDADNRIERLRVLIFTNADELLFNQLHDPIDAAGEAGTSTLQPITQQSTTGTRRVVFIANEPLPARATLDGIRSTADLEHISFAAEHFDGQTAIPMFARYDGVVIRDTLSHEANIRVGGRTYRYPSLWPVTLRRLAVRLEATVIAATDMSHQFTGITISNLPAYVPLYGNVPNRQGDLSRSYPADRFTISSSDDGWSATCNRIILPAKFFERGTGSLSDAVKLTVDMLSIYPSQWNITRDTEAGEFDLPRNAIYRAELTVTPQPAISLVSSDWESSVD